MFKINLKQGLDSIDFTVPLADPYKNQEDFWI